MLCDFHMHTCFSGDSETRSEIMIERAAELGMERMCITDHYDINYPERGFTFDTGVYYSAMSELRERFGNKIKLMIGVEAGLIPEETDAVNAVVSSVPFDFVIGSAHMVNGADPYYPEFFEGKSDEEAFRLYFETVRESIKTGADFDVYGHLDYIVRYASEQDKNYSYERFSDIIDDILCLLIDKGRGIEANGSGYRYGLDNPNPYPAVIKRYRELGGEIITVGSDAHTPEYIGYGFDKIKALLKQCGFEYYTVFENRKPQFIKID